MGLGKTLTCAAFLAGCQRGGSARRALVIAPKTLLSHWAAELRVSGLAGRTHAYYGGSERERAHALRSVTARGGVLLTTYGMLLHNADALRGGLGPVAIGVLLVLLLLALLAAAACLPACLPACCATLCFLVQTFINSASPPSCALTITAAAAAVHPVAAAQTRTSSRTMSSRMVTADVRQMGSQRDSVQGPGGCCGTTCCWTRVTR